MPTDRAYGELVRIVTFQPRQGKEKQLEDLMTSRAAQINGRFGAALVWCLRGESEMGIVSVWKDPERLATMRGDPEYVQLLDEIKANTESLVDRRFTLLAGDFA